MTYLRTMLGGAEFRRTCIGGYRGKGQAPPGFLFNLFFATFSLFLLIVLIYSLLLDFTRFYTFYSFYSFYLFLPTFTYLHLPSPFLPSYFLKLLDLYFSN